MFKSKQESIILGTVLFAVLSLLMYVFLTLNTGSLGIIMSSTCLSMCLVPVIGILFSVWHNASSQKITLPAGDGAALGAIVGALGGILYTLLVEGLAALGVLMSSKKMAEEILKTTQKFAEAQGGATATPPPANPGSFTGNEVVDFLISLLMSGVMYAVIGAIVGAIGAAMFKKGVPTD
jgi:ABC-type transport system involved in multi-copper enzyme maturation permease subunit